MRSLQNEMHIFMEANQDILFEELPGTSGLLGVITLNRPKALNALTHAMIKALETQLDAWAQNPSIKAVLIESNSEKAFCAGGDIVYVYQCKQKNQFVNEFFQDEYRLNQQIHEYPKPYISFLNGITMGGGVGISIHGSHRIGTEKLLLSMPETGIGFFPDIGASYFLPRCKNALGIYMGLTGARLKIADASYVGLIDYYISSERLIAVKQALLTIDLNSKKIISNLLMQHAEKTSEPELAFHANDIANIFSNTQVEEILTQLSQSNTPFLKTTLDTLQTKSPTSLKVTLESLTRGVHQTIGECIQMEYNLAKHFLHSHDFFEGIRAVLVDKDQKPCWNPKSIEGVTHAEVAKFFN